MIFGFNRFVEKWLIVSLLLVHPLAHGLCVKTSVANLRKGPGDQFPITWKVGLYTPLLKIKEKNGWFQVKDMDGQDHWVYRNLVTNNLQCMSVQVASAVLRKGPGSNHPYADLPSVGKYYSFKRIAFEPPWYGVEDESGLKAWIHESVVWRPVTRQQISF